MAPRAGYNSLRTAIRPKGTRVRQQGRAHGAAGARPAILPRVGAGVRTAPARRAGGHEAEAASATPSTIETASAPVLLALFLVSLLIPVRIYVGDLLFSPVRIFLVLAFLPLFFRLVSGKVGRIRPVDILIGLYCLWMALSLFITHGTDRIAFIGITIVELFGGYLVGRTMVLGQADYRAFFRYFFMALLFMLPFVLVEQVTRRLLINDIVGLVFRTFPYVDYGQRMGLNRIQTVFEHPILSGLFWSAGIGNLYFLNRDRLARALPQAGLAGFTTAMALSSGPFLVAMLQFGMIAWEKITRAKWKLLLALGILAYIVVDLLSNRTPFEVLISYATFNQGTAYNRVHIWNYGMQNVMSSPVFGIGLNDWFRPPWMHSGSFDNFWLLQAMRYGIPAFAFLALGVTASIWGITRAQGLSTGEKQCRTGYMVALTGFIFTLATVHVWGATSVFFMFYIGAGVWIAQAGDRDAEEEAPESGSRRGTVRPRGREAAAMPVREGPSAPEPAGSDRFRPARRPPPTRTR